MWEILFHFQHVQFVVCLVVHSALIGMNPSVDVGDGPCLNLMGHSQEQGVNKDIYKRWHPCVKVYDP